MQEVSNIKIIGVEQVGWRYVQTLQTPSLAVPRLFDALQEKKNDSTQHKINWSHAASSIFFACPSP